MGLFGKGSVESIYFHQGDSLFFYNLPEEGCTMAIVMGNLWNILLPFGDFVVVIQVFSADDMYFLQTLELERSVLWVTHDQSNI